MFDHREWEDFSEGVRKAIEANLVIKNERNIRIKIIFSILMSNGSVRSAAINAASLALMDASIELKDSIVSCSAGLLMSGPINSVMGRLESRKT